MNHEHAKAVHAADQENARVHDERAKASDGMTASERAMAESAPEAQQEDAKTTRHTPGPWTWGGIVPASGEGKQYMNVRAVNGPMVASVQPSDHALEDARLIAAAPELLEALRLALAKLEAIDEARLDTSISTQYEAAIADAAIAKATGTD